MSLDADLDLEHHKQGSKQHQTSAEEVPDQQCARHGTEAGKMGIIPAF